MPFNIRPTLPEEIPSIIGMLRRAGQATDDIATCVARERLMAWQYFQPREGYTEPRSYVCEADGEIVSHGGICPTKLTLPDQVLSALHISDWVADRRVPGSGIALYTHLVEMADCSFAPGSSQIAQRILPKLGFGPQGAVEVYMKSVRPVREFFTRPMTWKSPLRLARALRSFDSTNVRYPKGWSAERIEGFDSSFESLFQYRSREFLNYDRTAADLNYMLGCPVGQFEAFSLKFERRLCGYVLTGKNYPDARIADIRVESVSDEAWSHAYRTACCALTSDPRVCRIVAWSAVPPLSRALRANRFQRIGCEDVLLRDRKRKLKGLAINYQMLETDSSYSPAE